MPLLSADERERRERWRIKFRDRLLFAESILQTQTPLSTTFIQHYHAFRNHLTQHQSFEQEAKKLTSFEFEILAISSTKKQLENDDPFFSAEEVFGEFRFRSPSKGVEISRLLTATGLSDLSVSQAYQATTLNGGFGKVPISLINLMLR